MKFIVVHAGILDDVNELNGGVQVIFQDGQHSTMYGPDHADILAKAEDLRGGPACIIRSIKDTHIKIGKKYIKIEKCFDNPEHFCDIFEPEQDIKDAYEQNFQ